MLHGVPDGATIINNMGDEIMPVLRKLAIAAVLMGCLISSPAKAEPPTCNTLGDVFNAITLQPPCYDRIRKYNYDHSERSVTNLNEIYGAHSPEHPSTRYIQTRDSFGNNAWTPVERGW